MGLLDDAIREHLDLKRRRGADPTEVERDEREALGPVRRNQPSGHDDAPNGALDELDGEAGYDDAAYEEEPDGEGPARPFAYDQAADADDDWGLGTGSAPPRGRAARDEARDFIADPYDEPFGPEAPIDSETREFSVEEARQAEGDDDVLEETPDFLQDTPDHDRLWFEQRPPRDFDFDK